MNPSYFLLRMQSNEHFHPMICNSYPRQVLLGWLGSCSKNCLRVAAALATNTLAAPLHRSLDESAHWAKFVKSHDVACPCLYTRLLIRAFFKIQN